MRWNLMLPCACVLSFFSASAHAQTAYFSRGFTTDMFQSAKSSGLWATPASIATMLNEAKWVQGAAHPTSSEVAIATTDYDSRIAILFRVNGSWGTPTTLVSSSSFTTMRKFGVAYEQLSGDCLVAYSTGSTSRVDAKPATGGVLGSATSPQSSTNYIDSVRLYAKPQANDILLLSADGNNDLRATFWNGAGWGSTSMLTTSLPASSYETFDAAFESSTGTPMVVYSEASVGTPKYTRFVSGAWTAAATLPAIPSAARWIKLAADPTTNRMACVMIDAGNRVHLFTWSGSAWSSLTTLTTSCGYADRRPADVAFEPDGSHAVVVYSTNTTTPKYRVWDGSTLAAEASLSAMSGKAQFIRITPGRTGNTLTIGVADLSSHLNVWTWDGSSMGSMSLVESLLGGVNSTEQFCILQETSAPKVLLTSWREITPEN